MTTFMVSIKGSRTLVLSYGEEGRDVSFFKKISIIVIFYLFEVIFVYLLKLKWTFKFQLVLCYAEKCYTERW